MSGPVPAGGGWPGDPATAATPVARTARDVRELAARAGTMAELAARQSVCRACPRLVEWREQVASVKRKSSRDEDYWGRPVPGWGEDRPRILVVGLAPAAHGGNRTGRIFTGDRSGDVLFAALHRCGLAATATSVRAGDGQRLIGTRMAAAVRCAPPVNKPSVTERDTCAPWLAAEFAFAAPGLSVIVCLGAFAWQATWSTLRSAGYPVPRPRPPFGHGREVMLRTPGRPGSASSGAAPPALVPDNSKRDGGNVRPGDEAGDVRPGGEAGDVLVIGCYHPSQQNTFTGRVTPAMLDDVFRRAAAAAGLGG